MVNWTTTPLAVSSSKRSSALVKKAFKTFKPLFDLNRSMCCSDLQQLVVALSRHEEASVLQLHLSVLQQVVEDRQDVSLCLLQPLQDQDSALCCCPYGTLGTNT